MTSNLIWILEYKNLNIFKENKKLLILNKKYTWTSGITFNTNPNKLRIKFKRIKF